MAGHTENGGGLPGTFWRVAGWSAAALALLVPLVAMQFTDDVNWTVSDFVFAAAVLTGTGVAFELAVRKTSDRAYRAAAGVALAAAFVLVWAIGAVGVIGSEAEPVNLLYYGVLAVGIIGAVIVRFQPRGMAGAMFATAIAQASVAAIALIGDLGSPRGGPAEIVFVNGFFVALFVGSAVLFRKAARERPGAVAGS